MAYTGRPTSMMPGLRPGSQPSSALTTRIAAKKAELQNLRELRDLSGTLAIKMEALESKIATLKDGTEAVACVLANWDNVLHAITLASTKAGGLDSDNELPATLVRIPTESRQGE